MDGKKKLAGWLALTVIALVAAVALATTNLMTEKPIAEQNLGENQQALKAMFPEADEFAELSPGESSGVSFVYEVKQGGQTVGYAVKETVQGYGGSIEVLTGMETGGTLWAALTSRKRKGLGPGRRSRSLPISSPEKRPR
mgnify:CR=1 FL=1